ncbi:uncharacterized protein AAGF69_009063 isoform 2-T3 [Amazona ochrocephala]
MLRRKAPQERGQGALNISFESRNYQQRAGEARGRSHCQASRSVVTEVELVKRFSQPSPSSAARGPPKHHDKATALARTVFSLVCHLAGTLVSLWRYLLITCVFTVQKMAVHKKRCLKFVVFLLPVVLGSDIDVCSRNKDAEEFAHLFDRALPNAAVSAGGGGSAEGGDKQFEEGGAGVEPGSAGAGFGNLHRKI